MKRPVEVYWRMHVELQALDAERRDGPDGEAIRERMVQSWGALSEPDRAEVRHRLAVASGEV